MLTSGKLPAPKEIKLSYMKKVRIIAGMTSCFSHPSFLSSCRHRSKHTALFTLNEHLSSPKPGNATSLAGREQVFGDKNNTGKIQFNQEQSCSVKY